MSNSLNKVPSFAPIRKRVWIDTGSPHMIGFAIVELGPDGLRWWWEHDEQDVAVVEFGQIVAGTHCMHVDDVMLHLRRADEELKIAKARIAVIDRSKAWKLIREDNDR